MDKKIITKTLITILLATLFTFIISNKSNVKGSNFDTSENSNSAFNEIIDTEEKIMMYDAKTQETTEVDMDALKQVSLQKNVNQNLYRTSYYHPYSSNLNLLSSNVLEQSWGSATTAKRITNTSTYPYRVVCKTVAKDSYGNIKYGTATIIGPNLALTSAHCIFDENNNNEIFSNWTLYPGYNNGTSQGSSCGWSKVYYNSNWKTTHSYKYDWAICVLEANVGNEVGWNGIQYYESASELNGTYVKLVGYPSDTNYGFMTGGPYQYITGEEIWTVYNDYFKYTALSFGGFSGGPVMRINDAYIVGVHHGTDSNYAYATRITKNMVDLVNSLN